MRNPNVFVSRIVRPQEEQPSISPMESTSDRVVLSFANGRRGWYVKSDPRAAGWEAVLHELEEEDLPVYVGLSDDNELTQVLVPVTVKVVAVDRAESGDAAVRLSPSHAIHTVRKSHPAFDELVAQLEDAAASRRAVAVTESPDGHEILDVRGGDDIPFETAAPGFPPAPPTDRLLADLTEIDEEAADALFAELAAQGCRPGQIRRPCIPFLYPDDGCHARAHMMCTTLVESFGVNSGKIWLYGAPREPYEVNTPNHPDCSVPWLYHVAPIVRTPSGIRVVDPALFSRTVTDDRWRQKQFADGTIVLSDRFVFDRLRPEAEIERDHTLAKTRRVLGEFRAKLIQRISRERRPPPYC